MTDEKPDRYELLRGDKVIFKGTYAECVAEWQRLYEKERKNFHDQNAERQRSWEKRGGKDDDRDLC